MCSRDCGRQGVAQPPGLEFPGNYLGPAFLPEPSPPYVHTFKSPEPVGWDDDGNPLYPEPGPSYTLTKRPAADVVREAGFGPVPGRIEVTAEFCQCPACRAERCEP